MRYRWAVCLVHLQLLFYMWMIPDGEEDESWVQILRSPSLQMCQGDGQPLFLFPSSYKTWREEPQDGRKTGLWMTDNKKKAVIKNKFMRTLCLSRWILIFHITGSGFSFYFNFYVHTSVSLCECLCMHAWCPPKSEESISFPGTGFQGPSCRCWSSNTGLLEEQPVLLTGKLSL